MLLSGGSTRILTKYGNKALFGVICEKPVLLYRRVKPPRRAGCKLVWRDTSSGMETMCQLHSPPLGTATLLCASRRCAAAKATRLCDLLSPSATAGAIPDNVTPFTAKAAAFAEMRFSTLLSADEPCWLAVSFLASRTSPATSTSRIAERAASAKATAALMPGMHCRYRTAQLPWRGGLRRQHAETETWIDVFAHIGTEMTEGIKERTPSPQQGSTQRGLRGSGSRGASMLHAIESSGECASFCSRGEICKRTIGRLALWRIAPLVWPGAPLPGVVSSRHRPAKREKPEQHCSIEREIEKESSGQEQYQGA